MGHKSRTDDEIIAGFHKSHQHQWKQIEALEASNKRLREALEQLMDDISSGTMKFPGKYVCQAAWEQAETALAQEE